MKFDNLFTLLLASSAFAYHIQRRDEFGNAGQTLNQSIEANPAINPSAVNPSAVNPSAANPAAGNPAAGNPAANSSTNSTIDPTINSAASFIDNEFKNSNTKECQEFYDVIAKCISFGKGLNYELICEKYNTPECQEIVMKDFNACELYKSTPATILGGIRLICAKDENGKLCPISEVSRKDDDENNLNESVIKDTTKSKVCTEQGILALKEIKSSYNNIKEPFKATIEEDKKEIEDYDKYIAILSESKNNESSGATPLKVGSALLFSFVALLLSHF
ncbi:hypothetical protein PIROE2DRAFT_18597 [Piromyces sp. E2]|nr:hypothetical protein PIROE2DRAFT_18597 [Piromyces sp. E2]|eukprot:OUM56683.1 hypothetical protein PIROE2DRAFT_18597 [Piromyces sp. E2]